MNVTSRTFPYGVDEFAEAGLTKLASRPGRAAAHRRGAGRDGVPPRPHRRGRARAGTAIIIGEILLWHVHDDLVVNGRLDPGRLDAIGRMAGSSYARTRDRFDMPRPK